MKAPAFWYRSSSHIAAQLLSPAAQIYRLAGVLRQKMATSYRAKVPLICIGNIVVGGAGKTPVALSLGSILKESGHKPVFVTRGYGGHEQGPLRVDTAHHTAQDVGDEALLLARVAPVWIGRDRAAAIQAAEVGASHIILDDGLQNPHFHADINILVIDSEVGLGNGKILPAGPLRETLEEALPRITAVIMTGAEDRQNLTAQIKCPVVRATWQTNLPNTFPRTKKFLAFAGIGRPAKFYETCRTEGLHLIGTRDFSDHHLFSEAELTQLQHDANAQGACLLTTEKDWMRLSPSWKEKIMNLPVQLKFDRLDILANLLKI